MLIFVNFVCFIKIQWTLIDYLNQAPIIFDDFQKIMNQYDIFDKETASYLYRGFTQQ